MGFFGNKDKEKVALQLQLDSARGGNDGLKKQLSSAQQTIGSLSATAIKNEQQILELQERLKGMEPQSAGMIILIRYAARLIGLALVVASAMMAKWLAEGHENASIPLIEGYSPLWFLYLFFQCAGLLMVSFAPSRSHTRKLVFGVYMSVLLLVLGTVLVYSLQGGPIPISKNLIGLMVVNSAGVWLLIQAERILRHEKWV